jgi:hypothetical protein
MLAKLVGGLHKPADQTCLPAHEAFGFLAPLSVRVLPGVGSKGAALLAARGLDTVAQLRGPTDFPLALPLLLRRDLPRLCLGIDSSKVVPSGPPGRLSVEDSFKGCHSFQALEQVANVLVPDLLTRAADDRQTHKRQAGTFTVTYRLFGGPTMNHQSSDTAHTRTSRSVPAPAAANAPAGSYVEAALAVLKKTLQLPFHCTCLNLALSKFVPSSRHAAETASHGAQSGLFSDAMPTSKAAAEASRDFRSHYLPGGSPVVLSKVAERHAREGNLKELAPQSVVGPSVSTSVQFKLPVASSSHAGLEAGALERCQQYQCIECKALVALTDRQEHQDYHFACDFSRTTQQPTAAKKPKLGKAAVGSRAGKGKQATLGFKPLGR